MLARFSLQWRLAQRLARCHVSAVDDHWQAVFAGICSEMGLQRAARLLQSTLAEVPMVIGWLTPVVLVPVSALTSLTDEQLRTILSHEIAHIRRHDFLINCLQKVIESILFFHPVVWWVSNRMRMERENCCDDAVVRTAGNALVYARALSQLEALRATPQQLALAANGGSLMNRISRIIGVDRAAAQSTRPGWLTVSALTAGLLLSTAGLSYTYGAVAHPHDEKTDKAKAEWVQQQRTADELKRVADELHAMVAAGHLSKQEAEAKLIALHAEMAQQLRKAEVATNQKQLAEEIRMDLLKSELRKAADSLKVLVDAGHLSKQEAEAHLQSLHERVANRLHAEKSAQALQHDALKLPSDRRLPGRVILTLPEDVLATDIQREAAVIDALAAQEELVADFTLEKLPFLKEQNSS